MPRPVHSTGLLAVRRSVRDWKTRARLLVEYRSRLPDFIVIGAAKSGTTSLHAYLARQQGLRSAHRKEPEFFSRYYAKGPRWYASHFPRRVQGTLHFESTPEYLPSPEVPARLAALLPDCR